LKLQLQSQQINYTQLLGLEQDPLSKARDNLSRKEVVKGVKQKVYMSRMERLQKFFDCRRVGMVYKRAIELNDNFIATEFDMVLGQEVTSEFQAIQLFKRQTQFHKSEELVMLKSQILALIANPGENKSLAGLDLLHRAVFQLLMKYQMVDDLFKLRSPYL